VIADAFLVMALGMGGVFVFLMLLCLVMQWITNLFPSDPIPAPVRTGGGAAPAAAGDHALIAVLQAAVVAYEADTEQEK
jgi:sodium pump decarboxylase gamma subunit